MIYRDYHVHLYGCLSAEDLWETGRDLTPTQKSMLGWYAAEYGKAFGRVPDPEAYWRDEGGLEKLRSDYVFSGPGSFARFQACFNLIIALCPLSPEDFSIPEKIIRKVASKGLQYFEARTLISFRFSEEETYRYLKGMCSLVGRLNRELAMETRLVFSLVRDNSTALTHYSIIREFMRRYPKDAEVISGIDFAFAEEGHPPSGKKDLFARFKADNQKELPLDLLYHVGESFEDKGIISAVRWVWEAWELGCTRLGHAIALGVEPENYRGQTLRESSSEYLDTVRWLLGHSKDLADFGHHLDLARLRTLEQSLSASGAFIEITYDQNYIEEARSLQNAVGRMLKLKKVRIECCPTSNLRIGKVQKEEYHPLRFFHRLGLDYVIATDDPGVFAIDWVSEARLSGRIIGLSDGPESG